MTALSRLSSRPASDQLIEHLAEAVQERLAHEHPQPGGGEDFFCLNHTSYMGERMGAVLVRVRERDAQIASALAVLNDMEKLSWVTPVAAAKLRAALTDNAPARPSVRGGHDIGHAADHDYREEQADRD
ncbi:hypothetical protein [Nonomuraea sp. SBT364]|uniref:hypothetical protein n=1 Tax=Nonomuraea sp. SBT364 TaxID=1580530 RepID=UPI000A864EB0|nr:hypothetical protein [Nonomuraea sp. SBT364]